MTALKGIIAPFTTPFKANGEIDLTLIKPQVDWLIENGVHGLAAGGSTGEGHALSREEYLSDNDRNCFIFKWQGTFGCWYYC